MLHYHSEKNFILCPRCIYENKITKIGTNKTTSFIRKVMQEYNFLSKIYCKYE